MSPLELPGRSFGYLPDRRNTVCRRCGRGFRNFRLVELKGDESGKAELLCPYCGYLLDTVDVKKIVMAKSRG